VFDCHRAKKAENAWENLAYLELLDLGIGRRKAFEISVGDDKLMVAVDGGDVLSPSLQGRPMGRLRGLGAQAGSTGIWYDVRIQR
jgi:hypothetical protein